MFYILLGIIIVIVLIILFWVNLEPIYGENIEADVITKIKIKDTSNKNIEIKKLISEDEYIVVMYQYTNDLNEVILGYYYYQQLFMKYFKPVQSGENNYFYNLDKCMVAKNKYVLILVGNNFNLEISSFKIRVNDDFIEEKVKNGFFGYLFELKDTNINSPEVEITFSDNDGNIIENLSSKYGDYFLGLQTLSIALALYH